MEILNDVNLKLLNEDGRSRIVHVNRVRPRYVRDLKNYSHQGIRVSMSNGLNTEFNSELDQVQESDQIETSMLRRSSRMRRLPQYLRDYDLS